MHVADHHGVMDLDKLVRGEPDGKARDRLRVVALAKAGQTTPQIVGALKLPPRSMQGQFSAVRKPYWGQHL